MHSGQPIDDVTSKCQIRSDLLFREPVPSSAVEDEGLYEISGEDQAGDGGDIDEEAWDTLILEDEGDDSESDDGMNTDK